MPYIECTYYAPVTRFVLPHGLKLMTDEECQLAPEKAPFSWWVRWDTLHYYDENGDIHEIQPTKCQDYDEMKYPHESTLCSGYVCKNCGEEINDDDRINYCKFCNEESDGSDTDSDSDT